MFYRLGLIGYPLEYSLSPRMHQAALNALNLKGRYDLFPLAPTPEGIKGIKGILDRMRRGVVNGLNVTIPHKMSIIPYLDELTPMAYAIGAVNAVQLQGDKLVGDNFDCLGFLSDLSHRLSSVGSGAIFQQPGRASLVLGAGGSARAVVYGLLMHGWQVKIAARRPEQAEELAQAFSEFPAPSICELDDLVNLDLGGMDLIVNTTPLGMEFSPEASAWPDGLPFPSNAFIYDLVYSPPETALLRSARKAGLSYANGLGMLVQQAVMSFRFWTGHEPPVQVMVQSITPQLLQNYHPSQPSLNFR